MKDGLIIITCDGGGAHASRTATVAAYRHFRNRLTGEQWWGEILPTTVKAAFEAGRRTGVPELDALRHVETYSNQQVMAESQLPWGSNWGKLFKAGNQRLEDRLRLDCPLCRRSSTPNTLTIRNGVEVVLDRLAREGKRTWTIDEIRTALPVIRP